MQSYKDYVKEAGLNEAAGEKQKYVAIAVNRISKDSVRPVSKDEVELSVKQMEFLKAHGKVETIQGEEYYVLDRDYKTASKIKTPTINKVGRTSGYNELLFKKR